MDRSANQDLCGPKCSVKGRHNENRVMVLNLIYPPSFVNKNYKRSTAGLESVDPICIYQFLFFIMSALKFWQFGHLLTAEADGTLSQSMAMNGRSEFAELNDAVQQDYEDYLYGGY